MPRPTIDLEHFREAITARWEAYNTNKDIISYLAEHESLAISLRTLDAEWAQRRRFVCSLVSVPGPTVHFLML